MTQSYHKLTIGPKRGRTSGKTSQLVFPLVMIGLHFAGSIDAVSAAILNDNGDFADSGTQTVGTPVQTPPWSYVLGGINQIATGSQSPFTNVFGTPNARGVYTPEATGNANPYFVDTFASTPANATGFLYFSADFRNNTQGTGAAYSMLVTDGPSGAVLTAGLYISGNSLYKQDGPSSAQLVTSSLEEGAWYNVQLALNLTTNQYSGRLTQFGGGSIPIRLTNFATENAISGIYSDGGTAAGTGGVGDSSLLMPDHDIDNFVISNTPLAAASHNANKAFKAFEQSTSGPVAGVNGDWQYGTAASLGGAFTVFPASEHSDSIPLASTPANALQGWYEPNGFIVPAVGVNVTGASFDSVCCGTYEADEIWMHSGSTGLTAAGRDFAIVRWTAPISGLIDYSATFINESVGAGEGVYVLINGVPSFSGTSAGSDLASGTTANGYSLFVTAGTTIDFVAGGFGSTGLFADVSYVPEPSSLTLIALGIVGAAFARRRAVLR